MKCLRVETVSCLNSRQAKTSGLDDMSRWVSCPPLKSSSLCQSGKSSLGAAIDDCPSLGPILTPKSGDVVGDASKVSHDRAKQKLSRSSCGVDDEGAYGLEEQFPFIADSSCRQEKNERVR